MAEQKTITCPECGEEFDVDVEVTDFECPECGEKFDESDLDDGDDDKSISSE